MNKTNIEWVKNPDGTQGYTWNPITGCLNHIDGMCKGGGFPCYAYRLANGRLRTRYLANRNYVTWRNTPVDFYDDKEKGGQFYKAEIDAPFDPFYPRLWPERLNEFSLVYGQNTARTTPKGIFVCDMGELFGDWIPREWQEQIFEVIRSYPLHRFYLLTKQPQNLIKFSPFPDNCDVGVTATNHNMLQAATGHLRPIKATVKYISLEPLLRWQQQNDKWMIEDWQAAGINQVIIGAQTKPYKPPEIEWVKEIVEACDKAGVAVFLKNNLWPLFDGSKYAIPLWAFNKESRLRQELPTDWRDSRGVIGAIFD